MNEPICGWEWYQQHRNDHTQVEIDSLSIIVAYAGEDLPPVRQDKKDRGLVRDLVKSYSKKDVK